MHGAMCLLNRLFNLMQPFFLLPTKRGVYSEAHIGFVLHVHACSRQKCGSGRAGAEPKQQAASFFLA